MDPATAIDEDMRRAVSVSDHLEGAMGHAAARGICLQVEEISDVVRSLRNLPHGMRLRAIEREVGRLNLAAGGTYADFGCSNGYVTERIRSLIHAGQARGFDHIVERLERGRAQYPAIKFTRFDLKQPMSTVPRFDFGTCSETLEHVGDLDAAIDNLLAAIRPGGAALITVPIEARTSASTTAMSTML